MAAKRQRSPELIPSPFIKKQNREWTLRAPQDLPAAPDEAVTTAAIEAGRIAIDDHVAHFGAALARATRVPYSDAAPHLSIDAYRTLYKTNVNSEHGAHFVIHQHDHPVAGTHYDLRLQINGTSSASWAVMYGMPGDANSFKLARNATETRVHCLWNHLIETASATTGSLLIWDTGTYSVLKRRSKHDPAVDPSSQGEESEEEEGRTEQEKLHEAFRQRKIRIRLDGARLPRPYVLNLRLTKSEDAEGRVKAKKSAERGRRRRRGGRGKEVEETSSEEEEVVEDDELDAVVPEGQKPDEEEVKGASVPTQMTDEMRRELEEQEDAQVRATNAYVGADNSIGSVHQRKWFLSLDREASGFVRTAKKGQKVVWTREGEEEADGARLQYPFYVRGPEAERSVVTGRLAADVLRDEGVRGFIGRKGWRPVLR